jgi:hypothetical protein
MRTIGEQTIWSFAAGARQARPTQCTAVRKGKAHHVASFMQLATKVAELQFRNRDHVLLFRGQTAEYRNRQGNTRSSRACSARRERAIPAPPCCAGGSTCSPAPSASWSAAMWTTASSAART